MKVAGWYQAVDDDRRIATARMALWIGCFVPFFAFAFVLMEIVMGHPGMLASVGVSPSSIALACAWIVLYAGAGYLVGQRRAAGGLLGLTLFAATIVESTVRGQVLTLSMAYAIVGIVLILRAGRALRLPFFIHTE